MKSDRSESYLGRHWLWLLGFQTLPIVIAIVVGLMLTGFVRAKQGDSFLVWIAVILALVGLILLFLAKLPLYRKGRLFTFGSKSMPEKSGRVYRIAYALIGLGVVTMMLLLAVLR